MAVVTVDGNNFEDQVLKGQGIVIVDFWADWCGPCKMLSPIIDQIGDEMENIKVCKVDVDKNQSLAMEYQVMSIPTLVIFKDGKEVKKSIGVVSKDEIKEYIKAI